MTQDNPGASNDEVGVERFAATGRIPGLMTAALGALGVVLSVWDGGSVNAVGLILSLLVCWVAWTVFLRPRAAVEAEELVLRNMVSDWRLPLAAIEEVTVRQMLVVTADARRFVCAAVGRKRRQLIKDEHRPFDEGPQTEIERAQHSYGLFVEDRIRARAEQARARAGVALYSEEQEALAADVRRLWAWPEIVAGVVLVAACVVAVAGG